MCRKRKYRTPYFDIGTAHSQATEPGRAARSDSLPAFALRFSGRRERRSF